MATRRWAALAVRVSVSKDSRFRASDHVQSEGRQDSAKPFLMQIFPKLNIYFSIIKSKCDFSVFLPGVMGFSLSLI